MIVSSTQANSGRQPRERQGATPRPNAPPPLDHTPRRNAAPRKAGLSRRPPQPFPPGAARPAGPAVAPRAGATARTRAAIILSVLATVLVAALPARAQTTTFVSNLEQTDTTLDTHLSATGPRAQQFETGSNSGGYTLTEIVVNIRDARTGVDAFALYTSTADDEPGTKVVDLSGDSSTAGEQSFTPASATTLSASTKYFVAFFMNSGQANLQRTNSNDIDSGASTGWDIAENSLFSGNSGTSWSSSGSSVEIAVKGTLGGTATSTDATLSALALSGVTLDPTFVSTTETYTATVVNSVTETTVTATVTDSGATVAFKDSDDNALTNPVTLAVGANVIKAVVTAEDTTTTKTYMVTVTRAGTATTVPGAPTGLTATASGTSAIDLAWTAPSNDGGSAITGYRIEVSSDGVSSWTDLVADTDNTNTAYGDHFPAGTTRHYRVSAINSVGTGAASNVATLTVPGAPTGLTATASGTTAINLAWTAPSNDGGSAISGYMIEVSSDGGSSWISLVVDTDDTNTTYEDRQPAGTTRHYRVSAINSVGTGAASNVDDATTATTTLSTDATLSALALSGGTLAPTFVSTTETYTATVGNSVTATTVTATPTHSGATVAFKDGDDNALTSPVTLAVGDNVIRAVVTAEDTTTMKTYMVTVTRADTITTPPEIVPGGVQVTSTPATGDTYVLGETIAITVTFDKAVTVDTSGGRPRIQFRLDGSVRKWAGYSSGSGGAALEFTYTVQADDMDDDGIWLPANFLQLEGGTISAAADNTVDAILTYTSPGVQTEHKVDGSLTRNPRPAIVTDGVQVTSMPMATADTYGLDETIAITVTFDKAVTVDTSGGTPRIAFRVDGDLLRWADYSSGSEGTALVFTYTVQAGDMDADGIRLGVNSIEPFGGTIRDATDTIVDATLTYADPGLQIGHKVDGSLTTADATLSALALSGVTLDPTFVSSTETYTATVVNGVTETTVTATPTQSGATVAFKDGDDNALTSPVTLAVGATVIKAVVTAQDGTTTKTYMVTVTRAPAIVTVQVTSNPMATGDTYGRGETIEITVTFDNAVTVDTSGGTPRIAFHLDGGLRWAVYSSGSGDTALVFTYTVLANDRAGNGILLRGDQFDLFGGTIRAAPDNAVDATLTYADPGRQSGHKVDGTDEDDGTDDVTTGPTMTAGRRGRHHRR